METMTDRQKSVTERETEVVIGTRLAAERLAWDEATIRAFERRRLAEADRRRQAKLPVTERTTGSRLVMA